MSKYDFEIDLSMNSSTGIILNKLRPGSLVLEFGCAAGRMTRYMKEEMGCRVYIVEYEEAAFRVARAYAEDGICDDILSFGWLERFGKLRFDAILFVDVLEHLSQPEAVLEKAAQLLAENGCVYISVPNVTHNDVLLNAVGERFDYTETGLLDNTHVHFWGLENLKTLGSCCGLTVRSIEGTPCTTGYTEQKPPVGENILLENILRQRRAGEIYQFIVTLDRGAPAEAVCTLECPGIMSHIYLDRGDGFGALAPVSVESVSSGKGSYLLHWETEDVQDLCAVRLDPVEFQSCILRNAAIRQDGKELPLASPVCVRMENGLVLPGYDPMVIAQVEPEQGRITVEAEIILPGKEYIRILEGLSQKQQETLARLRVEHLEKVDRLHREHLEAVDRLQQGHQNTLQQLQAHHRAEVAAWDARLQAAENREETLKTQLARRQKELADRDREIGILNSNLCGYVQLVNQKEKQLIALEWLREMHQQQIALLQQQLQEQLLINQQSFATRIIRATKNCIKRILRIMGRKVNQ